MVKHKKAAILIFVFLVLISIVLLINNKTNRVNQETNAKYYSGFMSNVMTLKKVVDQAVDTDSDPESTAIAMFDVLSNIAFIHDRLNLMMNETTHGNEYASLKDQFLRLRYSYESLVRSQLMKRDRSDSEEKLSFTQQQLQLFINDLPKEYENSKAFFILLHKAEAHIKPLEYMNFP
ncbi:hypothetical protein P4H46_10050 [Paenibacillus glucanolyticus]|uniref:hypothetical protein n=1 Tax=Paenibacillus glucanolyticus TaxID=59843 RepID=UPI0030C91CF0